MSNDPRGIYKQIDFGEIILKIKEKMDETGITRNAISQLTGIKYDVIAKYYKGADIARVDLTILAKLCFVLRCSVSDLLEYREKNKEE